MNDKGNFTNIEGNSGLPRYKGRIGRIIVGEKSKDILD